MLGLKFEGILIENEIFLNQNPIFIAQLTPERLFLNKSLSFYWFCTLCLVMHRHDQVI